MQIRASDKGQLLGNTPDPRFILRTKSVECNADGIARSLPISC